MNFTKITNNNYKDYKHNKKFIKKNYKHYKIKRSPKIAKKLQKKEITNTIYKYYKHRIRITLNDCYSVVPLILYLLSEIQNPKGKTT